MPRQSHIVLAGQMVRRAENWQWVNQPLHEDDMAAIKTSAERGRPLGDAAWMQRIVDRLNFGHALRRKGWSTHEKV